MNEVIVAFDGPDTRGGGRLDAALRAGGMRETLAASMGPIEFSDLRAHLVRGAVIVVDASLDLLEVGEAVARDDKARVAAWVEAGLLGKPSLETIERWSKMEGAAWVALVVQPFVLLREGLDASAQPSN